MGIGPPLAGIPEESIAGIQLKNGEEDQKENIGSCRTGCEQRGGVDTETSDWSWIAGDCSSAKTGTDGKEQAGEGGSSQPVSVHSPG